MTAILELSGEDLGDEIFLNADHVHTLASAEEAARAMEEVVRRRLQLFNNP